MIVLLSGRKRSGKDSAARVLIEKLGFERYAFADPIKVACKEIFLLNDRQLDGDLKEVVDPRWGISPRRIFQLFGTDLMREHLGVLHSEYSEVTGEGLWVKRFLEYYEIHPWHYVVTDTRFPNELKMVREYFKGKEEVVSIRIERDSIDKSDNHSSEVQIDNLDVDYSITNNSSLQDLYDKVESIVEEHL